MPYGDAYHTRSATRKAGALVQRAVVARHVQMGSHARPVARDVQAVTGTYSISVERYPLLMTN
jgi:hypothetical protein